MHTRPGKAKKTAIPLKWSAPDALKGAATVIKYQVTCQEDISKHDNKHTETKDSVNECTCVHEDEAAITSCEVTGLHPGTVYLLRVIAISDAGPSEASEALHCTTLPSTPPSPAAPAVVDATWTGGHVTRTDVVTTAAATAEGCCSLIIAWCAPVRDHGDKVTQYRVEYCVDDSASSMPGRDSDVATDAHGQDIGVGVDSCEADRVRSMGNDSACKRKAALSWVAAFEGSDRDACMENLKKAVIATGVKDMKDTRRLNKQQQQGAAGEKGAQIAEENRVETIAPKCQEGSMYARVEGLRESTMYLFRVCACNSLGWGSPSDVTTYTTPSYSGIMDSDTGKGNKKPKKQAQTGDDRRVASRGAMSSQHRAGEASLNNSGDAVRMYGGDERSAPTARMYGGAGRGRGRDAYNNMHTMTDANTDSSADTMRGMYGSASRGRGRGAHDVRAFKDANANITGDVVTNMHGGPARGRGRGAFNTHTATDVHADHGTEPAQMYGGAARGRGRGAYNTRTVTDTDTHNISADAVGGAARGRGRGAYNTHTLAESKKSAPPDQQVREPARSMPAQEASAAVEDGDSVKGNGPSKGNRRDRDKNDHHDTSNVRGQEDVNVVDGMSKGSRRERDYNIQQEGSCYVRGHGGAASAEGLSKGNRREHEKHARHETPNVRVSRDATLADGNRREHDQHADHEIPSMRVSRDAALTIEGLPKGGRQAFSKHVRSQGLSPKDSPQAEENMPDTLLEGHSKQYEHRRSKPARDTERPQTERPQTERPAHDESRKSDHHKADNREMRKSDQRKFQKECTADPHQSDADTSKRHHHAQRGHESEPQRQDSGSGNAHTHEHTSMHSEAYPPRGRGRGMRGNYSNGHQDDGRHHDDARNHDAHGDGHSRGMSSTSRGRGQKHGERNTVEAARGENSRHSGANSGANSDSRSDLPIQFSKLGLAVQSQRGGVIAGTNAVSHGAGAGTMPMLTLQELEAKFMAGPR